MRSARAAAVSALVVATGCSLVTVQGPPAVDPGTRPLACTEARLSPGIDVGLSIFAFLGTSFVISFGRALDDRPNNSSAVPAVVLGAVPALPFALSAWYGFAKTGRCRALNRPALSAPPPTLGPPSQTPPAPPSPPPDPTRSLF